MTSLSSPGRNICGALRHFCGVSLKDIEKKWKLIFIKKQYFSVTLQFVPKAIRTPLAQGACNVIDVSQKCGIANKWLGWFHVTKARQCLISCWKTSMKASKLFDIRLFNHSVVNSVYNKKEIVVTSSLLWRRTGASHNTIAQQPSSLYSSHGIVSRTAHFSSALVCFFCRRERGCQAFSPIQSFLPS